MSIENHLAKWVQLFWYSGIRPEYLFNDVLITSREEDLDIVVNWPMVNIICCVGYLANSKLYMAADPADPAVLWKLYISSYIVNKISTDWETP